MQNRPEIDFLEEQYNEDMGVSELVVGQYELSEEMKLFLNLYEKKQDTIKKRKERVSLEVEKIKGIEEMSYVMLLGGNKNSISQIFFLEFNLILLRHLKMK